MMMRSLLARCGISGAAVRRFHSASARFEEIVVSVPPLGDSISEGSIVEWLKVPGDVVDQDTVVTIIETDKVSVDIRAEHSGKLLEVYADEDDTVTVGLQLFKIDSSDTAVPEETSSAPSLSSPSSDPSESAPPPPSPATSSPTNAPVSSAPQLAARIPRIHFRHGARAIIDAKTGRSNGDDAAPVQSTHIVHDDYEDPALADFDPMFGRVPMTQLEMDMVELGGAEP